MTAAEKQLKQHLQALVDGQGQFDHSGHMLYAQGSPYLMPVLDQMAMTLCGYGF